MRTERKCVRAVDGWRAILVVGSKPRGRNINRHSLNTQWRAHEINYNRIYGCFYFEAKKLRMG